MSIAAAGMTYDAGDRTLEAVEEITGYSGHQCTTARRPAKLDPGTIFDHPPKCTCTYLASHIFGRTYLSINWEICG